jgi:mono/diheme cytochrome c family protein
VPRLYARQSRSVKEGVYTAAQAGRGDAVYQMRCATCHGAALAGDSAPPLVGQGFLGIWGGQPLSALFDKIHDTMPLDAPGSLSRAQAADVLAHVLRANQFPAGPAELAAADATLERIALTPPAAAPAAGGGSAAAAAMAFPAVGNMNQLMRGILFPSSNVLFDVQLQDPGAPRPAGAADNATTTARYGNVYGGWVTVDVAAIALAESAPLLMVPRRCENGKPAPIERADWQEYVRGLVAAGRAAYAASQTRKQEAVAEATNQVSDACAACHRVYRDRASAALRCTAP